MNRVKNIVCRYFIIFLKIEDCEDMSSYMWVSMTGDTILGCIFYPESGCDRFL
jgi:hypothetical protein